MIWLWLIVIIVIGGIIGYTKFSKKRGASKVTALGEFGSGNIILQIFFVLIGLYLLFFIVTKFFR